MKHRALLAALAALAVLGAACGDSGTTETTGSAPATGATADLRIVAVDFEYDQESWTVSGTGITVEFVNQGTLEHNWVVLSTVIEDEGEFTDDMILWEIGAGADSDATGTIAPDLAPGTYQVICTIQGHFTAGMVGELTVTG